MNISDNLDKDQSSFLKKNKFLNENLYLYDTSQKIKKPKKNVFLKLRINDLLNINNALKDIHDSLPYQGFFIGFLETLELRRNRLYKNNFILRFIDFFFIRFPSKIYLLENIYYFFSKGKNRIISKSEIFGRLIFNGFDIVEFDEINDHLYFISKKIKKNITHQVRGQFFRCEEWGKIIQ